MFVAHVMVHKCGSLSWGAKKKLLIVYAWKCRSMVGVFALGGEVCFAASAISCSHGASLEVILMRWRLTSSGENLDREKPPCVSPRSPPSHIVASF